MGLIRPIVTLPLTVVKGVVRFAEAVRDQAAPKTSRDPAAIRCELERIAQAAAAGQLSQQQKTAAQQRVFQRMLRDGP
ncbi:gas vesicle protein GvpG [Nocardia gipuzkoensis]|uniref:gas vesicle protein GvpG n=1 Tax=Nocardia gipuzkoensis TaxID=2749991 RepID=UPI00237D6EB4|nr:gas vesicle protein G [Nocardia gipuzkoensis]MDE1675344.1 gas vesicle protein G [Nocardia gipuzkoensis]